MGRKAYPHELSYEEALRIAWQRGLLTYKLLPHQKDIYKIISNGKELTTVLNCSRRFGKTTCLMLYAIIFAIKNPEVEVKIAAATAKALRKTIFPIIRMILRDCPDDIRPKWDSANGCYKFQNGSLIHVHGVDKGGDDGLRGQLCHLGIVDEAAYVSNLKYVVFDVLLPQTITCDGRIILASTPNKKVTQSAEEFKEFCSQAEMEECYYTKTVHENTSLSLRAIKRLCDKYGGELSVRWRTEFLCEFVIDPEKSLVPEWNTGKYVAEVIKPDLFAYYHKYVSLDLGVKRDFTCALFGYYDFLLAKLIILDEWYQKNMTSVDIVNALRTKENLYFTNQKPYRRVADSDNPLLLNDLCTLHAMPIMPTTKTALESMVNNLRVWVGEGRVIVHPRCKFLIGNLEKGVWADNAMGLARKDFGRTSTYGHFDGVASLMYLVRNIDTSTNPIPADSGVSYANHFTMPDQGYQGPHKDLANLFGKKVFKNKK